MTNERVREVSAERDVEVPDLPQSLPDFAYQYLRNAILKGEVDFGAPLRQEDIGERLRISRLPIREALRRLEAEGLVVLKPRRGYFVASLNWDEIEDIFDTAALLEERAGYFATLRRTPADVKDLEAILKEYDRLIKATPLDIAAFGQANARFHARLFALSGRAYLRRLLTTVHTNVEHYTRVGVGLLEAVEGSSQEHHAILDALRAGDAEKVGTLCRIHRENTGRRLLEYLKNKPAS